MVEEVKKKEVKGAMKKTETKRAYTRYIGDPVFIGLIVLCVLLIALTIYFASGAQCQVCKSTVQPTEENDTNVTVPVTSNTSEKIAIYVFSEFKCPYCAAAAGFNDALIQKFKSQDPTWEPSVPKILETYGDKVDVQFKHFIVHDSAKKAAEAAECARDQGKFWEMHDIMFENQAKLEVSDLKSYAKEIGLNSTAFDECLDSGKKDSIIQADIKLGKELGVSGTPTFIIGGKDGWKIVGAQPFKNFKEAIDKALEGKFPEPPPGIGPSIGTFDSLLLDSGICTQDGKPIVRMFSTTTCPHCKWVGPTYDATIKKLIDEGKVIGYHWEVNTKDNTLTTEVETQVPESELAVYKQFNPKGSVPTFVFGCKYYRIGTGYERENNLTAEQEEFEKVIEALLNETAA